MTRNSTGRDSSDMSTPPDAFFIYVCIYIKNVKKAYSFRLDERLISRAKVIKERNGLTLTAMVEEGLHLLIQRYDDGNELNYFEKSLIRELGEVTAKFGCKIVKSTDVSDN